MDEIKQLCEYVTAVHELAQAHHETFVKLEAIILDIDKRLLALEKRNDVRPWFSTN